VKGPLTLALVASVLVWGSMFAGMFFGLGTALAEKNADSVTRAAGVGAAFVISLITFVWTAGMVVVAALLVGGLLAIFRISFLRSFLISYGVGMLAALLLSGVSVAATLLAPKITKEHTPAREAASASSDDEPAPARKVAENPARVPEPEPAPTETKKGPSQEAIQMARLIQSFAGDISAVRLNYFNAASGAGLPKVLDADRLAGDLDLTETKKMLATGRAALERARARTEELTTEFPGKLAEIHSAPALESVKAVLMADLPLYKEHWDREAQTLDCYEEATQLLHAQRALWRAHDNAISITSRELADKFTELMKRMGEGRKRQQAMVKQVTDNANRSMAQLAKSTE